VSIPRRKTLALFAYLAVTAHSHSRDALATLLWPEDDPSTGRANLRRAIFELKQLLGEQALSIDRAQAGLASETSLSLDVADFKQRVAKVREHQHKSAAECESCLNTLTEVVDLYNGNFMAGFSLADCPAFDEWQFFEAESLRQALAESLQPLVDWHTRHKAYQPAIEYARRWLALDPLHEPAQRQLIRLYALSDQLAAALRQCQECIRLLQEELGVEPAEETMALYEAIRSKQLFSPLEHGEVPPAPPQNNSTPPLESSFALRQNLPLKSAALVGRKNELSTIISLMRRGNACRLVTVTGPGGSGKTRLVVEAASILANESDLGYQDGIWFIYLASISRAGGILEKMAQAIGFSFPPGGEQRFQKLFDFLRQKQMLFIRDNFEHLTLVSPKLNEHWKSGRISLRTNPKTRGNQCSQQLYNTRKNL